MTLPVDELREEQLAFKVQDMVITPQMSMLFVLIFGIVCLFAATIVFSKVDFSRMNRWKGNKDIFQQ